MRGYLTLDGADTDHPTQWLTLTSRLRLLEAARDCVRRAHFHGYDDIFARECFVEKTRRATDDRGVDLLFDSIGGLTHQACFDALASLERVVVFRTTCGKPERLPSGPEVRLADKTVLGFSRGSLLGPDPAGVGTAGRRVSKRVLLGRARLDMTGLLPLEEARGPHGMIESGRSMGKLVLG